MSIGQLKTTARDNKQLFYLLWFLPLEAMYFISQRLPLNHIVIDLKADRAIPFIAVFIVPYVIWYVYVPGLMVYMYFKERSAYVKQCMALFVGMALCIITFIVLPTALPADFRPQTLGGGVFDFMCRIIYANDMPYNVCPSLHCYEAVCIHIMTFYGTHLKKRYALRISSAVLAVLICLSTVYTKQHSIIDMVVGILLAAVICFAVLYKGKKKEEKQ